MIMQNLLMTFFIFVFLFSQQMINALSCYYCSSKIHGNDCNDPFIVENGKFLTTFNSSYKACAKIILATIYGGVTIRGPRKKCNSMDDDTGSLWCCYMDACNNSQQNRYQLEAIVFVSIVLFLQLKFC